MQRRLVNLLILTGVGLTSGLLVHRVFAHYLGTSREGVGRATTRTRAAAARSARSAAAPNGCACAAPSPATEPSGYLAEGDAAALAAGAPDPRFREDEPIRPHHEHPRRGEDESR